LGDRKGKERGNGRGVGFTMMIWICFIFGFAFYVLFSLLSRLFLDADVVCAFFLLSLEMIRLSFLQVFDHAAQLMRHSAL
jgi:lipopolysaccharide export LptBFGC system permease protein LptF